MLSYDMTAEERKMVATRRGPPMRQAGQAPRHGLSRGALGTHTSPCSNCCFWRLWP